MFFFETRENRLIIPSAFAIAQTRIHGRVEWKSMFHPSRLWLRRSRPTQPNVYTSMWNNIIPDVAPAQTSCLDMEIHSTDCCTIKCSLCNGMMDHSRSISLSRSMLVRLRKAKSKYFYCVYMEITSLSCVYQFIITTASCERKRIPYARRQPRQQKKEEEHVIDLTIKPLNITITTNVECTEWKLLKHKIYHRIGSMRQCDAMGSATWK